MLWRTEVPSTLDRHFVRSLAAGVRSDAIAGLSAPGEETVSLLLSLVSSKHRTIREESLRSLRFAKLTAEQMQTLNAVATLFPESGDLVAAVLDPTTLTTDRPAQSELKAWQKRLAKIQTPVDLEAGRRIFHHASIGTCAKCHRHGGRGGVVGPDLTATNTRGDDDRLLAALLLPSRDIDPQYFPRMLLMEDGTVFTGLLLRDGGGGREVYRDNSGKERAFETEHIVQRKELSTSMMPDGLIELMTDREIRDLLAFLDSQ